MQDFILWGTIVDTFAVVFGALIGLLGLYLTKRRERRKKALLTPEDEARLDATWSEAKRKPYSERIGKALIKGFALCTIYIGVTGMLKCQNELVLILSMTFGILVGEAIDLDRQIKLLGDRLGKIMKGRGGDFAEGLVTSTLLFCTGAMTINGAIMSGLGEGHSLLYSKSILDFCAALVYASSMGVGVLCSAVPLFLVEGLIVCVTAIFGTLLTPYMIAMIGAVGSLLIIALGLNILGATKLKVMNYIPAIFMPLILCLLIPA